MRMHNEHIIAFLNRLPITGDRAKWMDELRAALLELFPDVDKIAININVYCDPVRPHISKQEEISVRFSTSGDKQGLAIEPLSKMSITEEFEAETGKFVQLEKFHPPRYFHYIFNDGQYMGSMIFFREIGKPATSEETFRTMEEMTEFIKYIYASFLAMQNAAKPFGAAFLDAQCRMEEEAGFSLTERKVMTLKLAGKSYKDIAEHLDISLNTVRSHIKSIHRKTHTRSYTELFAKYFTPVAGDHIQ